MKLRGFAIAIVFSLFSLLALTIPAAADEGNNQSADLTAGLAGTNGQRGNAVVSLNSTTGTVCWNIRVSHLTSPVILAHIHRGGANVNGPVVVPFFNFLAAPSTARHFKGCTSGVSGSLIDKIVANPGGYYVNVHTLQQPGGAVRGQLSDQQEE